MRKSRLDEVPNLLNG